MSIYLLSFFYSNLAPHPCRNASLSTEKSTGLDYICFFSKFFKICKPPSYFVKANIRTHNKRTKPKRIRSMHSQSNQKWKLANFAIFCWLYIFCSCIQQYQLYPPPTNKTNLFVETITYFITFIINPWLCYSVGSILILKHNQWVFNVIKMSRAIPFRWKPLTMVKDPW